MTRSTRWRAPIRWSRGQQARFPLHHHRPDLVDGLADQRHPARRAGRERHRPLDLRPAGQWNNQRVTCKGSRITVELNGTKITDVDLAGTETVDGQDHPGMKRTSGHIGFFGHGSRVEFRRIKIRSL